MLLRYHEKRRTSVIHPLRSGHPGRYKNGNFFPVSGCQRHALIEKVPVEIISISVFMRFYPAPLRPQGNALRGWRRRAESPRRLQTESHQVVAKRDAKYERRLSRKKQIPGSS